MHFRDNALPPEVNECQVHVESSLCGQFQFPENTEVISGVYWITMGQKFVEFVEPVIVEFQHCTKPKHVENLTLFLLGMLWEIFHTSSVFSYVTHVFQLLTGKDLYSCTNTGTIMK